MGDELTKDDAHELQCRRMADQIREEVEKTLKKRYTWLALIVSVSIISGVITSIVTLNSTASKKLAETEYLLDKSKTSLGDIENISKKNKKKIYND